MANRFGACAAGVLMAAFALSAHAAPETPAFPRAPGAANVGRWLAGQTDLPLSSVVLVGPGYVFAFLSPDPPPEAGLVWRRIREEVTSPAMEDRLGGRSATATVAFDCAANQATASNVVVYSGNSLQGVAGRAVPAADWLVANPGLYLMDLAKAACDGGYRRPFTNQPALSAETTQPPAAAAVRALSGVTGPEHWVQFGAFTNVAAANRRWRAIQKLLPVQTTGRSVKTESVGHGKTLVRALVGPFRGAQALAFCTALKARGGDCLVH